MKLAERDLPLWLGGAAISAIALGQMAVVLDALAVAHPSWPFWVHVVVAAGFELAVLSTGLAVMLTGDRGWPSARWPSWPCRWRAGGGRSCTGGWSRRGSWWPPRSPGCRCST